MIDRIVRLVRDYEGLKRKKPISSILEELRSVEDMGRTLRGFGEDCAVFEHEGGNLLLAAESIWSRLLEDPEWAGYCSVLANVNDVYAMGGRPLALVNTLSFRDENEGRLLARGMRMGAEKFRVPIVGGHVHPESECPSVSLFVVGSAENPMSSFGCGPGDDIIVAVDTDGRMKSRFLNFDSTSGKASEDVLLRLEALVEIANRGLVSAAKDISNPGVLGSIGMLLETSLVGAVVDVGKVPRPDGVDLNDWIRAYPGFGFIVTCKEANTAETLGIFRDRGITAEVVGQAIRERRMTISFDDEFRVLFDLEREAITGAIPSTHGGVTDE
ncbi:MAG: AIR synthase related protein [Thermoplasmata archaeon]